DFANCDLPVHDPRTINDPADTQDRNFQGIDDSSSTVGTEYAVVIKSKSALAQLRRGGLAAACSVHQFGDFGGEFTSREPFGVLNGGHHQTTVGLCGHAQVHPVEIHDLFAVIGLDKL